MNVSKIAINGFFGRMGQTIHQFATKAKHCPVKAVAHRVHHILSHGGNGNNYICDVYQHNSWSQVTPTDMIQMNMRYFENLNMVIFMIHFI